MENVASVCAHLSKTGSEHVLTLIPDRAGRTYWEGDEGVWRAFSYIDGAVTIPYARTVEEAEALGTAVGTFTAAVADIDPMTLRETIPGFHDTARRVEALQAAITKDARERRSSAETEIRAAVVLEQYAEEMRAREREGLLVRVAHNDAKAENVLLREHDMHPLCLIDFDTVMPGYVAHDFGELIRSALFARAEDDAVTPPVIREDIFLALVKSFLNAAGSIRQEERATLVLGAILMPGENGIRFLTDYLEGDRYFTKVDYPEHNLIRARAQLQLAAMLHEYRKQLEDIVAVA
jgi:thiamine kinase-like enzyme